MKHFIENANGRTLFFIDELGGGSDPNLGGAFAEVILEELAKKHSIGIVTTHYLNLKINQKRLEMCIVFHRSPRVFRCRLMQLVRDSIRP
jgi:DNA mismatch repair protein MutS2